MAPGADGGETGDDTEGAEEEQSGGCADSRMDAKDSYHFKTMGLESMGGGRNLIGET